MLEHQNLLKDINKDIKQDNNVIISKKYDDYIKKVMFAKNNTLWSNRIRYIIDGRIENKYIIGKGRTAKHKSYPNIYNYLKHRYNDIPDDMFSIREVILRIKYNIEKRTYMSTL